MEKQALCLGLDFAIAPSRVKQVEIDSEFEDLFHQLRVFDPLPDDRQAVLRAELVKLSKSYGRTHIERSCLLPCHVKALKELKQRKDLIILRPDKGGAGVVVMNQTDYVAKVEETISDPRRFQRDVSQVDASGKTMDELSRLLKRLRAKGVINDQQHLRLKPQAVVPPRLYGLPKTHKANVPVRPIVSMTRTVYEGLSKWLADLLKPVEEHFSGRCVKDSFEFVKLISDFNVSDTCMVSFDVSSLFTNVPLVETVDIIVSTVKMYPELCSVPPDLLKELLLFCTSRVQFLFNGVFYRQLDGVAMGSALGPLFANIFMGHVERLLSHDIDSSCLLYVRYVDDTYALVRDRTAAHKLFRLFNSAHVNLNFTFELERNDCLSFLDVTVHRRVDGSVATSIFRKKTWTGIYLNFHSFVPAQYKRGLIRSLYTRVVRLCSPEFLNAEFELLYKTLVCNSYPPYFIDKYKVTEPYVKPIVHTAEKKTVFLRVPFYGDKAAISLRNSVNRLISCNFFASDPRVLYSTRRIPVRSPKDPLPGACTSSVVYKFLCDCGSVYFGRTSRRLAVRVREHVPKWLVSGRTGVCRSAITDHVLRCTCDRNNLSAKFTVVAFARHDRQLRILEAMVIKRFKPDLCKQKDLLMDLLLPW